ncbi:chain length determinant protein [Botryobacter ruber]|uniref:chain length determinant protein n=1 Tax=Botryobacter ruber TaxID=2171629 RepID=UPI000E0CB773|nr:chain length determinant protein [Botryobacter ruber]
MNELKEKEYQYRREAEKTHDEIDLRLVFRKIGSGIDRLKYRTVQSARLARRHALLVLIFVLAGLGIGYAYYLQQRPYYNSTMTLMLYNIRNEFVEDQLKRLSYMVDDGNHAAIASRLEISPEAASEIRSLKVTNLDEGRISDDSILTGSPFQIDLSIYNNELFSTMEPALVNFLESNKFFSKQKQIRENQVRKIISKLKSDIGSIDSVKTSIVAPQGPVNGFVYGEAVDPTNLYRESVSMYKEQVMLESDLDRLNNLEVVNGFVPRLKPAGPKPEVYLTISGLLGLLAGLIVAGILEKRRRGI